MPATTRRRRHLSCWSSAGSRPAVPAAAGRGRCRTPWPVRDWSGSQEAVLPGECTINRELSGGAHPYLSFRVETTTAVAPSHEYALLKEQRRLDAGDRWLAGSFDPAALARALWRGTLLKTPPLRQAPPGLAVFRLPSRNDARAHRSD